MGKVFTWEDVCTERVPDTEKDFYAVSNDLKFRINEFDGISAAVFCGSFLAGQHSMRSDLDCVLVYSEKKQDECFCFFQSLIEFAEKHYVPLELVVVRKDVALTLYHPLQKTFLEHVVLSAGKGGIIKGNIVQSFKQPDRNIRDETISYIISKIRKFEKGWIGLPFFSDDERYRFLSKILDCPMHIARKMCRTKGVEFRHDDSKSSVIKHYHEVCKKDEYDLLKELVNFDSYYSKELKAHLAKPNFFGYHALLKEIESLIPVVLEFSHKNLRLIS